MKKLSYAILSALLLGSIMSGCSNEEDVLIEQNAQKVTLIADQESYSGKTSRSVIYDGVETGGNYVFMQWEPQDQIGVFSIDANGKRHDVNYIFTNPNKEVSNTAEFTGELNYIKPGYRIYAYYPYKQKFGEGIDIHVDIPQFFKYKDLKSLSSYDFKIADYTVRTPADQYPPESGDYVAYTLTGTFKPVVALLRFNVNLPQIKNVITKIDPSINLENCFFKEVKMVVQDKQSGDYMPLTGKFLCKLTEVDKGLTLPGFDPKKENSLTVAMDTPQALNDDKLTFYSVVAPSKTKGKKLTCNLILANDAVKYTLQFATDVLTDFDPSRFYQVDINDATIKRGESIYGTDVKVTKENLVVEETANCYVISKVGNHKFNANVIGNGQKGIIPNAGFHTDNATIHPVSAKLLWQDTQNFVSDVKLNSNGWVEYKANANVGNAVIAVYDGPNATGKILWSWHVWGIGDEPLSDIDVTNNAIKNFKVMDRPLGAHSTTSCIATLYQWGRKDPFTNASTYYDENGVITSIPYQRYEPSTCTITNMIEQPNTLVHVNTPLIVNNLKLWGDGYRHTTSTIDSKADNTWMYVKTIYDPSPAGYRVANMYTFTGFVKYGTGYSNDIKETTVFRDKYDNPDMTNNGYKFKCNPTDTKGIFFPFTGHRIGDGTMYGLENHCSYWSSSTLSQNGYPNLMQFGKPYKNSYSFDIINQTTSDSTNDYVCAIRCVRDDNNLVVNK